MKCVSLSFPVSICCRFANSVCKLQEETVHSTVSAAVRPNSQYLLAEQARPQGQWTQASGILWWTWGDPITRDLTRPTCLGRCASESYCRSPSPLRTEVVPISDEDFEVTPIARPKMPLVVIIADVDHDKLQDVIFVCVLRPPQVELQFHLTDQLEVIWEETGNYFPMNAGNSLPMITFNPQKQKRKERLQA